MTNYLKLLDQAVQAIISRPILDVKNQSVIWSKESFQCLPTRTVIDRASIIYSFNVDEFYMGFTSAQWDQFTKNIVLFFERKKS